MLKLMGLLGVWACDFVGPFLGWQCSEDYFGCLKRGLWPKIINMHNWCEIRWSNFSLVNVSKLYLSFSGWWAWCLFLMCWLECVLAVLRRYMPKLWGCNFIATNCWRIVAKPCFTLLLYCCTDSKISFLISLLLLQVASVARRNRIINWVLLRLKFFPLLWSWTNLCMALERCNFLILA
jgi:hypothetical protein